MRASSVDLSSTVIMTFPLLWYVIGTTGHEGDLDSSCRTVIKDTVNRNEDFLVYGLKVTDIKKNFSKKEFYCMGLVSPSHVSVNSRKDEIVELL